MPPRTVSFEDQVKQLVQLVTHIPKNLATKKALGEILVIASQIPSQFFPSDFADKVAKAFSVDVIEMRKIFSAPVGGPAVLAAASDDFEKLVPPFGWLHDYIEYTRNTEPPTVFHFFSAMCVLGATLGRRINFPRGNGDIFPNLNVVLVAPAGKCKKTTACNLAVNLYRAIGGHLLADKVTPEAIIESFKGQATATGLIYAPEWAVFLGKQQYMEGLVPMLTSLFDCPETWTSSTIMRATTVLNKVAINHLAATTTDWMQTSITKDAFSGGFMSRLLFIVQHDTPRSFPLPPPLDAAMKKRLIDGLMSMQRITNGVVSLDVAAERWYIHWYKSRTTNEIERQLSGYFERKPDRLIQIAMILQVAEDPKNLVLGESVLRHAEAILNWIERLLPSTFSELAATAIGEDQQRLLKQIRAKHGEITHSDWVKMNRTRLSSDTLRKCVETLKQAGMVVFDTSKQKYYLLPAGWKED